jgi:hypothetical protein
MDVNDLAILEKIERLAYQAGAAGRGDKETKPGLSEKGAAIFRKLKAIGLANPNNSGVAVYAASPEFNLEWEEIAAFAKES